MTYLSLMYCLLPLFLSHGPVLVPLYYLPVPDVLLPLFLSHGPSATTYLSLLYCSLSSCLLVLYKSPYYLPVPGVLLPLLLSPGLVLVRLYERLLPDQLPLLGCQDPLTPPHHLPVQALYINRSRT